METIFTCQASSLDELKTIIDNILNHNRNYIAEFRMMICNTEYTDNEFTIVDIETPLLDLLRNKLYSCDCTSDNDDDRSACLLQLRVDVMMALTSNISNARTRLRNTEQNTLRALNAFYNCNRNEIDDDEMYMPY